MNKKETCLKELDITQYQDPLTSMTYEAKDVGCHRVPGDTRFWVLHPNGPEDAKRRKGLKSDWQHSSGASGVSPAFDGVILFLGL